MSSAHVRAVLMATDPSGLAHRAAAGQRTRLARAVGLGAVTIFSPVVRLKIHPSAGTLQSGDCTRKLPRYVRVGRPRAERSRGELPACQARIERETVRLPVASLARRARRRACEQRTMDEQDDVGDRVSYAGRSRHGAARSI